MTTGRRRMRAALVSAIAALLLSASPFDRGSAAQKDAFADTARAAGELPQLTAAGSSI